MFASGACDDKATGHRSVGVIGAVCAEMVVGSGLDSQDVPMVDMVLTRCLCLRRCREECPRRQVTLILTVRDVISYSLARQSSSIVFELIDVTMVMSVRPTTARDNSARRNAMADCSEVGRMIAPTSLPQP